MSHPTFMYRRAETGEIDARIFNSDNLPSGWVDSPAKLTEPTVTPDDAGADDAVPDEPVKKKPGRPKKDSVS